MEIRARRILKYETANGRCPFDDWLDSLGDMKTQAVIANRLNRVIQGNFGLCRKLGSISELKVDFGPGCCPCFIRPGSGQDQEFKGASADAGVLPQVRHEVIS